MRNVVKFLVSVIGCQLVGILSAAFTVTSIATWYNTLNKTFFNPPNWIFGPVWTLLYFFMGVSVFLVWKNGLKKEYERKAIKYFLAQLVFNFLWTFLFFGLKSPFLGFISILILWWLILMSIIKFYRISSTASYLLLPYLLWVSFATLLNFSILLLNL